jgi:GT2 family glycosyltransferase
MSAPPLISVILCAYNPRADYLQATLESLRAQDLPTSEWELVVVDNNSQPPLAGRCDLRWHPNARLVVETTQGLAHARRRGYVETKAPLVVHSDDDNVLAAGYLSSALRIFRDHPRIGTFGGQLIPRFERAPRNELEASFGEERRLTADRWSTIMDDTSTMPWGAGMCVRREVIDRYLAETGRDPRRLMLGRTGTRLMTGEDLDLNYTAVAHGYGTGLFAALTLEHFIPARHLDPDHHVRYKGEANGYSVTMLKFFHLHRIVQDETAGLDRLRRWARRWFRLSAYERRRQQAWDRGVRQAAADIRRWGWMDQPRDPP